MVRKRTLTPEEKLLWKHVTRNDTPFKAPAEDEPEVEFIESPKPLIRKKTIAEPAPIPPKPPKIPKKQGDYAGIDKNTAEKFRKGDAEIDGKLDLHGMSREKAHPALVSFILKHVKKESRRLLVITGKGSGILRDSLPGWIAAPNISGYILAFDVAQAKHGGSGAYYILLKRKR